MVKIKVEGPGANIVHSMVLKALEDQGLKVNEYYDCLPHKIPALRAKGTKESADVSLLTMRRGAK